MKKLFIVLAVFLSVSSLYAQQAGQFSLGGRIGGAVGFGESRNFGNAIRDRPFANWEVDSDWEVSSPEPSLNFTFALYGNLAITSRVSVQGEFNFMINHGYDLRFTPPASAGSQSTRSVDVEYHSLDIPILLKVALVNNPVIFGIKAGPHVSIPLGRGEVYDNISERYLEEFDVATPAVFGVTGGLFLGIPAGPGRIIGDMRLVFDLNSLEANWPGGNREFISRRAFVFSAGYEISF